MELMQSRAGVRTVRLDPRTKLILLVAVSTVMLLGGNTPALLAVRAAMLLFPFALVALAGRRVAAIAMLGAYAVSYGLAILVAPTVQGIANSIIVATCTVVSRFMPTLVLAYFVFSTTTVSEFMAAMERMHAPSALTIPLSVLFRLFPTLGEEARAINAAMRMRGITPWRSGLAYVEYCLVPLMYSAVSIGEDLSAAALTRGLGAPVRRTNLCRIGFHAADIAVIAVALAATAILSVSLIAPEVF